MQILRKHHKNSKDFPAISVASKKTDFGLSVKFDLALTSPNTNEKFNTDSWDNEGLWDYDVVEVFIRKGNSKGPYLELQVSPLGQKFALLVKEPRKQTSYVDNLNTTVNVQFEDNIFKAEFLIHAEDIPGDGDSYFGNFFSCLGTSDERGYFALNINKEDTPDYHRPDLFREITSI